MKRMTITVIICVLFAFVFFAGCGKNGNAAQENKKDDMPVIPVEVSVIEAGDITAYISSTATLEAEEETEVVAKVGGVVEEIYFEEGMRVKRNDVLAKLDDEKIRAQVDQAKASLQKLENEKKRNEELYEKKLISAEDYQASQYDYEYQKAAYEMAKLDLDYTSIRSPIDGIVAQRMIKVGNMVLANSPVFKTTAVNPLWAVLHIPERHLGKLIANQKATLRIDALNDEIFKGYIKRISPVVDPATGTVKVTVEVNNPEGELKPGMFSRVNITYDTHQNTILVPKDALIIEDQESSVFVLQDSLVVRRGVLTGYVNTTHIEILEGIALADTVITTGKGSLKDSSHVEIVGYQKYPKHVVH